MNWKEFFTGYKGKDIPKELNEFNWGAFLLTFIWGIKHKAWITLLGIPLIWYQLPLGINWILYTALQFYAGFRGNMWAYQVDWWMKPADFRRTQALWAICAVAINIFIPIILLLISVQFIKKSPDNPMDFINNTQCTIAYAKLNKEFKHITLNSTTTDEEIAKNFAKKFKNAEVENNTVKFAVKTNGKNENLYSISFTRLQPENQCNRLLQNCVIESSFILPDEISLNHHCKFYFDYDRNFEPDEETRNRLDKGYNIFKYL